MLKISINCVTSKDDPKSFPVMMTWFLLAWFVDNALFDTMLQCVAIVLGRFLNKIKLATFSKLV